MNTQKIQAGSVKGFTLVELIVVITILVILGTIAFLNLGGMSASARDSQRTSDLNQINTQIMTVQAKNSTTYMNMLSGTVANALSWTTTFIAGSGISVGTTGTYNWGDVNYTVLGIDAAKMSDPSSKWLTPYKMGVTTLAGGVYEIAATLEETPTARIMGTYKARKTTPTASGTYTLATKTLKIDSGLGLFKANDWVGDGTATGQVSGVSADLTTIYFSTGTFANATSYTTVHLAKDEPEGLISEKTDHKTAVTDKGVNLPYALQ